MIKLSDLLYKKWDFSTTYKWDITVEPYRGSEIPPPPSPFDKFLPITDVNLELYSPTESSVTTAGITASYPTGVTLGELSFTLLLDDEGRLAKWLTLQEELRYKRKPLLSITLLFHIKKYSRQNQLIWNKSVIGFLSSSFKRAWNSNSEIESVNLLYRIVGVINE